MDRVSVGTLSLLTVSAVILMLSVEPSNAMQCTRRTITGNLETFMCPGLFDKGKKEYCCGTEMNRYCCKLSKAREHGYRGGNSFELDGKKVVKGFMTVILIILLVVGGCIGLCCFCVCYMMKKKRTNGGHVVGGDGGVIGGQSVHVVPGVNAGSGAYPSQPTGYGAGATYPSQPAYPAYPSAQPAYPMTGMGGGGAQPPPYPTQPAYNPNYPQ